MDTDNSGGLDSKEFCVAMKKLVFKLRDVMFSKYIARKNNKAELLVTLAAYSHPPLIL